jgi:hypothetical protein
MSDDQEGNGADPNSPPPSDPQQDSSSTSADDSATDPSASGQTTDPSQSTDPSTSTDPAQPDSSSSGAAATPSTDATVTLTAAEFPTIVSTLQNSSGDQVLASLDIDPSSINSNVA